MAKSVRQRSAEKRERYRAKGLIRREVWIDPNDIEKLKKFEAKSRERAIRN